MTPTTTLAILGADHDDVQWIDIDIAGPDAGEALLPVRETAVAAGRTIVERPAPATPPPH